MRKCHGAKLKSGAKSKGKAAVKERPIPLLDHEVRAILDDGQTQTRIVVKPQPILTTARGTQIIGDEFHEWPAGIIRRKSVLIRAMIPKCPYGLPGSRLWVQEVWAKGTPLLGTERTYYKADEGTKRCDGALWSLDKWRPSINMSRSDSRLLLEVEEIRVERLQDIDEEGARAEGAEPARAGQEEDGSPIKTYRTGFVRLWNSINEKLGFSWELNPWVFVIGFRRVGK